MLPVMTKDEILTELLKKKTCHRCRRTYTLEDFGKNFYCRKCMGKYNQEYRKRKVEL